MAIYFYNSVIGGYGLEENAGLLTHFWFKPEIPAIAGREGAEMNKFPEEVYETPLLREASGQLDAYFAGRLKVFSLPLAPKGTDFQQKVWNVLRQIPYGETRTYGEIALLAGNPKASRAVGMANNRNPLPVFIPCHRVIGTNGSLTGYAGGLDVKLKLLQLEGCF